MPTAAVDVLSTPSEAVLDDLADVVWYPTARPVSYRAVTASTAIPAGTRAIHSDADAAADARGVDWYALTWTQRAGSLFQRVTVIVSQSLTGDQAPRHPSRPTSSTHPWARGCGCHVSGRRASITSIRW